MSEEIKTEVVTDKSTVVEPAKKPESKTVTMTQDELDALIGREKGRVKSKYADYDDVKVKLAEYEKQADERKKAEMSEAERLQAEKTEVLKKAQEIEDAGKSAIEKANQRLIKAEFRVLAKEIGVRKDAMDDAFVLADLSATEVDEEGAVKGVAEAIESLKKAKAYLFGGNDYADPSPGQHEVKRDGVQEQSRRKLEELATKAKKTGRIEDKVVYASLKTELGL